MGNNKKNKKENEDESSNFEVGRSIATLKQKKTSSKSSFTRTKHKFDELLNEDLVEVRSNRRSRREVKQFQKKIDKQLQQVVSLLTEFSVLYEQSKNLDGQNRVVDEMEKIDAEYNNVMD